MLHASGVLEWHWISMPHARTVAETSVVASKNPIRYGMLKSSRILGRGTNLQWLYTYLSVVETARFSFLLRSSVCMSIPFIDPNERNWLGIILAFLDIPQTTSHRRGIPCHTLLAVLRMTSRVGTYNPRNLSILRKCQFIIFSSFIII